MINDFTAIIPVKANSSRLPGKNILPFNGTTLLEHKIMQLQQVKDLSRIIVSSDSKEMLSIAQDYGVDIDRRPEKFANESLPFSDFLNYITSKVDTSHLLWSCCTSPLVDAGLYTKMLGKYLWALDNGFDSLITTCAFQHFLLDESGTHNFKRGRNHVNSQDLPRLDLFTNGAIFSPVNSVRNWEYHFGPKAYRYNVTQAQAIDIDTKEDYLFAKALWKNKE